jgi:hypothetical protein
MTAATRGLYYSYIITSQSYSTARFNGINTFNKLDTAAEPIAELVDAIIVIKCYTSSTAFYITNHRQ